MPDSDFARCRIVNTVSDWTVGVIFLHPPWAECRLLSPFVSQSPHFGNISQMAQTILISFCLQFLFMKRKYNAKFRFWSENCKRGFSWGLGELDLKITIIIRLLWCMELGKNWIGTEPQQKKNIFSFPATVVMWYTRLWIKINLTRPSP